MRNRKTLHKTATLAVFAQTVKTGCASETTFAVSEGIAAIKNKLAYFILRSTCTIFAR